MTALGPLKNIQGPATPSKTYNVNRQESIQNTSIQRERAYHCFSNKTQVNVSNGLRKWMKGKFCQHKILLSCLFGKLNVIILSTISGIYNCTNIETLRCPQNNIPTVGSMHFGNLFIDYLCL